MNEPLKFEPLRLYCIRMYGLLFQNVFVVVDLYGMVESVSVISSATIGSEGSISTPSVESETGHHIQQVNRYSSATIARVKVLRINPEFRILRLTFHRKSASIC